MSYHSDNSKCIYESLKHCSILIGPFMLKAFKIVDALDPLLRISLRLMPYHVYKLELQWGDHQLPSVKGNKNQKRGWRRSAAVAVVCQCGRQLGVSSAFPLLRSCPSDLVTWYMLRIPNYPPQFLLGISRTAKGNSAAVHAWEGCRRLLTHRQARGKEAFHHLLFSAVVSGQCQPTHLITFII